MKRSTTEVGYARENARKFYRVACLGRRDYSPVVKGASYYHEVRCGQFGSAFVARGRCLELERRFPGFRFSVFSCDPAEQQ